MAIVVITATASAAIPNRPRSATVYAERLRGPGEMVMRSKTAAMRTQRALAGLQWIGPCPPGVAMCCRMPYAAIQFDAVEENATFSSKPIDAKHMVLAGGCSMRVRAAIN